MFYELARARAFDGESDWIDLSAHLHRFLSGRELSATIVFSTQDPGYQTLLALYYKESLLPDFALELHKGRPALIIRRGGALRVFYGERAYCDGLCHTLAFRGTAQGVEVRMDGERVIHDAAPGPYCEYGYIGFATIGRGTCKDSFSGYFRGTIQSVRLAEEELASAPAEKKTLLPRVPLFSRGMCGSENFRIPSILTTKNGVTIASADARVDAPGDNPNHICRAVRTSRDSGRTWSEPRILFDFGGCGRADGAAAIDGSLLYDENTGSVLMLYSHTSAGIGSALSQPGTGFDGQGRKLLWDREGREYRREADGTVTDAGGSPTEYTVDALGRIFRGGREEGSVCHGEDRLFRQADTSFLHLIRSDDDGETWSEPMELNPQVKAPWMKFIGAGPGTGLCLREGAHSGRLIYPVYFSSADAAAYSSGAIYSDDHGVTWHMGASVNDGRVFEGCVIRARDAQDARATLGECQVTELPGGRLKIFLRNSMGRRTATAVSDDGGEIWRDVEAQEALTDPECQSHVLRVRHKGRSVWLFSNPECEDARVRGTVKYSADATRTWQARRLLEPGEFGYSCMTQLPDGNIGILYEGADITQYFSVFPIEWVLEESDGNG